MVEMLKAHVHLIVKIGEETPFSYRTDVLTLTRDTQWVYDQSVAQVRLNLTAVQQPTDCLRVCSYSVEWVPTLRDARRG